MYVTSLPPLLGGDEDGEDMEAELRKTSKRNKECEVEMQKCREEARISHLKTRRAVRDARQTLAESDDLEEINEINNKRREENTREKTLEDIYNIIGKYLMDKKPESKKKPTILSVEEVNPPKCLQNERTRRGDGRALNRAWADIAARVPWKSRINEKYDIRRTSESQSENLREPTQIFKRPNLARDNKEREIQKLNTALSRSSRSAAIILQGDGETNYNEIILKAKREISLVELGINDCKVRRGYTGGMVIEIPGEGATDKADVLAERLRQVLANEEISIRRPSKRIDLKVIGMEDTTSKEEIASAFSEVGGCGVNELRVSDIRRTAKGMRIARIQCPIETAIKILNRGYGLAGRPLGARLSHRSHCVVSGVWKWDILSKTVHRA